MIAKTWKKKNQEIKVLLKPSKLEIFFPPGQLAFYKFNLEMFNDEWKSAIEYSLGSPPKCQVKHRSETNKFDFNFSFSFFFVDDERASKQARDRFLDR